MVGLHINGIWFVQLIGLHVSVMGVYLDVAFTYRFCDRWKENILFFIPSYLTLLAAVVEVILCRWSVCVCVCVCVRTCVRAWRVGLCFYSNGAKFIFMYYKLFLHKKCSIQKKYWFWMTIIFRSKMRLFAHCWFYMCYSTGVRNMCCSAYWGYVYTAGFMCYSLVHTCFLPQISNAYKTKLRWYFKKWLQNENQQEKTEVIVWSKDPENINIKMDDDSLKQVPKFEYLGIIFKEEEKNK